MKNFIKSKVFWLLIVTITLFVIMGLTAGKYKNAGIIGSILSVPATPVQKFFTMTGNAVEGFFANLRDAKDIREENQSLRLKVEELEKENRELSIFREKIEELRNALSLKEQFSDYRIAGANVIAKDPGNWFDIFRVDLGARDGVVVDAPVVTAGHGLIGRVYSTDATSSKIISIFDEDSSISGWISKTNGGHVIVQGDLSLKDRGLCRMNYITSEMDVAVNDIIETSGLGGIYPKGIVIGRVVEIRKDVDSQDQFALIEPVVNFKKLEEVFILIDASLNTNGDLSDDLIKGGE
ncbi:MAG: rod shape-determining protein MreC [Clostridiales bacterium]|nr:rod shape-determining protein MreC [Clostridiales bacterium]